MSQRILIADDESHILNVVSLKLRNAGFEVITACDGGSALEKAQQERPALLITDFHMPVMSGVEVCLRLQELEDWKAPAILLTARGNEICNDELAAGGIVEVISKPFSPRLLLVTASNLLNAA